MPFYPGPGLGGHCIPIDPYYLTWKAKEFKFQTTLIEAAGQVNHLMPDYVVSKSSKILNNRKLCFANSKIVILGVAYKRDIDDYRESPVLRIIELLEENGAALSIVDPHVKEFKGENGKKYSTIALNDKVLEDADLVILTTDHSDFKENEIIKNSKVIYDTRNFFKTKSEKIIKL